MISNIWFVGSTITLQSQRLQVEHGSLIKSDHMQIPIKLAAESFFDLHQGWNFS